MLIEEMFKPGILQITNADYHASPGISRSGIMELKKSPLHYYERYVKKSLHCSVPSKAMTLGSLVHTLVLEPHLLDVEYFIFEKTTGTGSRSINEELKKQAEGKTVIDVPTFELAYNISSAVLSHPRIAQFMLDAKIEQSLYWNDPETGLLCKARPDIWNESIGALIDLKTTSNASIEAFTYSAKDGGYHIQAAMQIDATYYAKGLELPREEQRATSDIFAFIVTPTEAPHKPYIYELGHEEIELGRLEYRNALKVLKRCYELDRWDLDRERIAVINFSRWQLDNSNSFSKLMEIYK